METIDGTAVSGEDYVPLKEIVTFQDGETEKELHVEIVDDNQWEPDETFFLKLCILPEDVGQVLLGRVCIMEITILNDDGKWNYRLTFFTIYPLFINPCLLPD